MSALGNPAAESSVQSRYVILLNPDETESVYRNPGYPGKSEHPTVRRDFQWKCESGPLQAQVKFKLAILTSPAGHPGFTCSPGGGLCGFQPLTLPRGQMQTTKFRGREAGQEVRQGMGLRWKWVCVWHKRVWTRTNCLEQQGSQSAPWATQSGFLLRHDVL